MMLRPMFIAMGLLTTLPVPCVPNPTNRDVGFSVLMYPLVGVVIGTALWLLATMVGTWPPLLQGSFVLFLWLALSGGLHLEGLGDLADGWVGGLGGRERMLAIMKDPRCGAAAVMAISMQLLFKLSAIQTLLQHQHLSLLFFAPILGRTAFLPLMLSTPYLRQGGMASTATETVPKKAGWAVVVLSLVSCATIDPTLTMAVGAVVAFLIWFRWMMLRRLGGITGDILGAACELSETVFLLACVLLPEIPW